MDLERKVMELSNTELECTILGSCLKNKNNFMTAMSLLSAKDFFDNNLKAIYLYFVKCFTADHVPSIDDLIEDSDLKAQGINPKDIFIIEYFAHPYSIEEEIRNLKRYTILRSFITLTDQVNQKTNACKQENMLSMILEYSHACQNILFSEESSSFVTLQNQSKIQIAETLKKIEDKKNKVLIDEGIRCNYKCMNYMLGGFGRGHLILIGARPGMGKSALLCNLALQIAKKDKSVCVFSLEMTKEEIINRCISMETSLDSKKFKNIEFTSEEKARLEYFIEHIIELGLFKNLYINDTSSQTIESLSFKMKQAIQAYNVDIIFIDYIQLLRTRRKFDNRITEVGYISSSLKILAKELHVPIVALCQLNRQAVDRAVPLVSDLRESGSLEQDADAIILMNHGQDDDDLNLIVGKNRHGETGVLNFKFDKVTGLISEVIKNDRYI